MGIEIDTAKISVEYGVGICTTDCIFQPLSEGEARFSAIWLHTDCPNSHLSCSLFTNIGGP